jgi:hypothetical protein
MGRDAQYRLSYEALVAHEKNPQTQKMRVLSNGGAGVGG